MKADELSAPPSRVVVGLAESDAARSARAYFEAFRWEPLAVDPEILTSAAFFRLLEQSD